MGHANKQGGRNTPTILNTAYQFHQFWDGRAKSLEEQSLGPIQADVEMNMPLDELVKKIGAIKGYQELFEIAYPKEGITKDTIAKAIASFERTIVSPPAPFDDYIKGDKSAINSDAKAGFELFKGKAGCTICHDGFNFTDGSFHNIGVNDDVGRYGVRAKQVLMGAFKTPTLRDVTKSGPYFHDGSEPKLDETIRCCAKGGKNPHAKNISSALIKRDLSKKEIAQIEEFLKSLESEDVKFEIPFRFPQ
jgi:cytochrome c peroxidase